MTTTVRWADAALVAVVVELTLTTAYIHAGLRSPIFVANAAGYLVLGLAYAVAVLAPLPLAKRFAWLPRLSLAAFTIATIGAYLVIGPYFTLGWVAKAVEVAILTLIAADVLRTYGSVAGLGRSVLATRLSGEAPSGRSAMPPAPPRRPTPQ